MVRAAAKNHAWVGVVTDPARYDAILDELRADGGRLSPATRADLAARGLRPHRRLRRRHRPLARPRPAAPPSRRPAGEGGDPPLRREPPPGRRPLPGPARRRLARRDGPARRQGAVVHQPPRLRVGLAAGQQLRRPRLRHRQARQPLRRGPRRHGWPRPTGRRSTCDSLSAFGGVVALQPAARRGDRRAPSARSSPRWCWPRLRRRRPSRSLAAKKNLRLLECPAPAGRRARPAPGRRAASSSRRPTRPTRTARPGRW